MYRIFYGTFLRKTLEVKPRSQFYAFQKKLFIFIFLAVSLGPLLTISLYLLNFYESSWIQNTIKGYLLISEIHVQKVEALFGERGRALLESIYLLGKEKSGRTESIVQLLWETEEEKPFLEALVLLDREGKVVNCHGKCEELVSKHSSPLSMEVILQTSGKIKKEGFFFTSHGGRVFFLAPFREENSFYLLGLVNKDYLRGLFEVEALKGLGTYFLYSADQTLLLSPEGNHKGIPSAILEFLMESSPDYTRHLIKEDKLYLAIPLFNRQWFLFIQTDLDQILKDFHALKNRALFLILLAIIVLVVATISIIFYLVEGLEQADTQRFEMTTRIIETEKMALIGKLASNVAHEINNPLQIIEEEVGWIKDLLAEEEQEKLKNYKDYQESLLRIDKQIKRARIITHRLLGLRRSEVDEQIELNVNSLIEETITLLKRTAERLGIEIRTILDPEIPVIQTSPFLLQQAFFNIINNAIEAIKEKGIITIETGRYSEEEIFIRIGDTGPGIPSELLEKIFDPFFSTKRGGVKNVGLGLYITATFVKRLQGKIKVSNKPEGGALFEIILPVKRQKSL